MSGGVERKDELAHEALHGPVVTESSGYVASDVVNSMFSPGTPSTVITLMNVVFITLLVVLASLLLIRGFNIHLAVMLAMTVVLIALINWLLIELDAAHKKHVAEGGDGAKSSSKAKKE
ncbi:uncharacterized protein AMSG_04067 [Thecamonas trahens ATCC 50062]|uniref:Uncharacterized protein n=1 Tax=Thecamonas trahens ATCC 50062 TaxID=461836 RepID=A0A0L0D958_THETB|nr:hypothetical protein AMSG_04067 [Thecamonas trahens ATCC 50062]KNC47838.1 hypothetical protein AMSG_04067 [Thecamonas trahens ATCC 50062]|eukprot:XP_013759316.1 hypothetical protein AMSG_04067 [Thecamonas trahens ATCC 50062]